MESKHFALAFFGIHLSPEFPCFCPFSLCGEFLPFLAPISHLSFQCDKTGDHVRPSSTVCTFKFPNSYFFLNVRFTVLLNLWSHISLFLLPTSAGHHSKIEQKPILINFDSPLLEKHSPDSLLKDKPMRDNFPIHTDRREVSLGYSDVNMSAYVWGSLFNLEML